MPKRRVPHVTALTDAEAESLARALKAVTVRFDNLWQMSFPYVQVLHQAPTDAGDYRAYHFFVAFHPPLRQPNLLKYLAGPEVGGGNFLSDTSPEAKAAELRGAIRRSLSRARLMIRDAERLLGAAAAHPRRDARRGRRPIASARARISSRSLRSSASEAGDTIFVARSRVRRSARRATSTCWRASGRCCWSPRAWARPDGGLLPTRARLRRSSSSSIRSTAPAA